MPNLFSPLYNLPTPPSIRIFVSSSSIERHTRVWYVYSCRLSDDLCDWYVTHTHNCFYFPCFAHVFTSQLPSLVMTRFLYLEKKWCKLIENIFHRSVLFAKWIWNFCFQLHDFPTPALGVLPSNCITMIIYITSDFRGKDARRPIAWQHRYFI